LAWPRESRQGKETEGRLDDQAVPAGLLAGGAQRGSDALDLVPALKQRGRPSKRGLVHAQIDRTPGARPAQCSGIHVGGCARCAECRSGGRWSLSKSPRCHASSNLRTISTFSCDIAYSERPTASRACPRVGYRAIRTARPSRSVQTIAKC
jgi:hypothetical protein